MMATTSSINMQSLGKIVQRAPALGAKMWCLFLLFVCFFVCLSRSESGAPCVRGVHSSNTHCVVIYRPILTRFAGFFFGRDCNYASIWTLFTKSITGPDVLCNALNISQIRLQMAPQDSQNCGRDFAKRKQTDAEFAANSLLRMVIIDIAINVLLSRVTRHPVGMHCPSWDDAFFTGRIAAKRQSAGSVFTQQPKINFLPPSGKTTNQIQKWMTPFTMGTTSSITMQSLGEIVQRAPAVGAKCVFLSRSESGAPCVRGVHSSNTHCVAIYRPLSTRFAAFSSEGIALSDRYIVLTFVARWRHNFR